LSREKVLPFPSLEEEREHHALPCPPFVFVDRVAEIAKKRGKATGIHIANIEAIKTWRTKGMTVLAYSTDISFQYNASKSALEELKKS